MGALFNFVAFLLKVLWKFTILECIVRRMTEELDTGPIEATDWALSDTASAEQMQNAVPTNLRERASQTIQGYQAWAERYPFVATAAETAVVFAAKKAIEYTGDRAGVNVRNALISDHIESAKKNPIRAIARIAVAAPLAEEVQFRGPAWLHNRLTGKSSRVLDSVMLLGFTAAHAGVVRLAEDKWRPPFIKISTESTSVPVVPLLGGINYARLSKTRGFSHALLAHVLNNGMEIAQAVQGLRHQSK
jgi:hypothetical protein